MAYQQEIYLDDNATTRVLPLAAQEAFAVMENLYGNPSSSHIAGLQARRTLESARAVAREVLGAPRGRIVFTSGATEAIQTGIFSALCKAKKTIRDSSNPEAKGVLLYGATEHKAIPQALEHWNRLLDLGCDVLAVPVDFQGKLDLDFLRNHINHAHILCTMYVNNETGVIHDLGAIESIVRSTESKVPWMVDSVQAVGKIDLNLSDSAIDYAPISGHKLHAPKGIGVLYVSEEAPFTPLIAGGGQEGGARGGTENLPGVAAIASVLRAVRDQDEKLFASSSQLLSYRDRLLKSLNKAFPRIAYNTPFDISVSTTINFAVPGVTGKELLDLFDAAGIRVSSGSACGSAVKGSYVLEAMGLPKWQSEGAIRLSFGLATIESDIDSACERIEEAGIALSKSCLVNSESQGNSMVALDGLLQIKEGSMCSWILSDATTGRCIIVDPFQEMLDRIETVVRCQKLNVIAVLDTHQHVDHDSPREELIRLLGERVEVPNMPTDVLGWPIESDGEVALDDNTTSPTIRLSESQVIAKVPLPGHTVDGQAFLVGTPQGGQLNKESVRFAFTGDTLLIGGIGRTDFKTSAAKSLLKSLRKLPKVIAPQTIVCPTHDYTVGFVTTLASEKRHNQLLAQILDAINVMSVEDYLAIKDTVDAEIEDDKNCELVCGNVRSYEDDSKSSIDIEPDLLEEFFRQHQESLIIDVRESHEFYFAQDWKSLGLESPPKNVPLTRMGDFLSQILQTKNYSKQEIIFLCRSGNRSAKAAQVVRRLGVASAWHISGGIALGISPSSEVIAAEEIEYAI